MTSVSGPRLASEEMEAREKDDEEGNEEGYERRVCYKR